MRAMTWGRLRTVANERAGRRRRQVDMARRTAWMFPQLLGLTRLMSNLGAALLLITAVVGARPTATSGGEPTSATLLTRIGFGSCAKQDKPQPIWDAVVAGKPQLFLMIGDNIYGDTEDMELLRRKYDLLGAQPGFQALRKVCPVLATWDDHDLGANDAGADFPKRDASQQIFLDFFGVAKDSPRRKQAGVYHSEIHGPPGRRVQIILLDARYFRSKLKTGFQPSEPGEGRRGKYAPNDDANATVLGELQWKWLERTLREPAELRLICSSYQAIPDEHGSEAWGNFPLERRRLFELIRDTKAEGVVLLSGDRHLAEVMRLPPAAFGIGYPLYEITSSSLNAPSGNLTKAGVRFANEINSYRVGLTFFDTNYGWVEIDWQPDPIVRVQVRDEQGGVVLQQRLKLSELRQD
jgi:alkaline phosphatase D